MPISDDTASRALHRAGLYLTDMMTPTLRLGVTGLSRSGKTVFITALVRNLVSGGRLPFFFPEAEGRIERAYLEPQPDDAGDYRFTVNLHTVMPARPDFIDRAFGAQPQPLVPVDIRGAARLLAHHDPHAGQGGAGPTREIARAQ